MKKGMLRLLFELLKDSKRSDRELAKVLGVSQPTVSRTRSRLVREGIIQEFTVIPDFVKMGYELMAITCTKIRMKPELFERARESTMAKPSVICAARAEGMGKNGVMISMHKDYTDFSDFLSQYLTEWNDEIEGYDTILISLKGKSTKPFSLKYLAEQEK